MKSPFLKQNLNKTKAIKGNFNVLEAMMQQNEVAMYIDTTIFRNAQFFFILNTLQQVLTSYKYV